MPQPKAPVVLQASTNLSIRQIVTCDERISYQPDYRSPDTASIFAQKAYIRAQGKFHEDEVMSWLGKKIEKSSWERSTRCLCSQRRQTLKGVATGLTPTPTWAKEVSAVCWNVCGDNPRSNLRNQARELFYKGIFFSTRAYLFQHAHWQYIISTLPRDLR